MSKPSIETCLSPLLLPLYSLEGKTVVITDVLRATSCMIAGFSNGVKAIAPVTSVAACNPYKEKGFLRAGERGGVKIDGFDLGNSPYDYMSDKAKGQSIVTTTTNGTRALKASEEAGAAEILVGAFPNIEALAAYLKEQARDAMVVCAGWKNRYCLEDSLFAGGIAHLLEGSHSQNCDATNSSKWLYQQHASDLIATLKKTDHAKRLGALNTVRKEDLENDLAYCSKIGGVDIIPRLEGDILCPIK